MKFDYAIIITLYNPNYSKIIEVVDSQKDNLGGVLILMDNSSEDASAKFLDKNNTIYISNSGNLGIATAQNIGIKQALKIDAKYIIFFDQDSIIEADYPTRIISEFERISKRRDKLFALGPKAYRALTNKEYDSLIFKSTIDEDSFSPKREIISSGSCVKAAIFEDIGLLEDKLFIDLVDFEICWRATSRGYQVGITQNLSLAHSIGQREIGIFKYRIIISSPFRYFYQYRNYLWLCCRNYVPLFWKVKTGSRMFIRLLYFPFVLKGGSEIAKNSIRGIIAAFKG